MTSQSPSPTSSSFSLPFSLVESVLNNHIPTDDLPPSAASENPLPNREALLTALTQTDTAINAVEDQISQFYFRNGTFARETDGLRNLNDGVNWFKEVKEQALQSGREATNYNKGHEDLDILLSNENTTTATLVVLNALHKVYVLSAETEKYIISGAVDVAYQQLIDLERAVSDLCEKNDSLSILNSLQERTGVLRDVLSVETEKIWGRLVQFSEEGDIQMTMEKQYHSATSEPLSIEKTAEMLKSLNLLDSAMRSLSSLLSRAFFDHLLSNPVGWQFIYRKHHQTSPSIRMHPTSYTLTDLTPHGHRIFAYFGCIVEFLASNLPAIALEPLIPLLVPLMTTKLVESWLGDYIPATIDGASEFDRLCSSAREFETRLYAYGWTAATTLHDWCARSGELWGQSRRMDVLDQVRSILPQLGVTAARVTASPGALQYVNTTHSASGSVSDWNWDHDWDSSSIPLSTSSSTRPQRTQRHSTTGIPRTYECTGIPQPLINLLGSLLQEYTQLSYLPILQSAQQMYPFLLKEMFSLFRATAILFAPASAEIPIRLINDCTFLSGEIALMALGVGHMGYEDIKAVLEETSTTMDLCGVTWRERYLEHMRSGLFARIQAAEGFIFPSNNERRERYNVIISGVISEMQLMNSLWMKLMTADERCQALGPLIMTVLQQMTDDIMLLPTLTHSDTSSLASLYSQLLSMENLFQRNRISEFIPVWARYRVVPQLLEMDQMGILGLWRSGRLQSAGWEASDVIEIIERRFGRSAEAVVRQIR